MSEEVCKLFMVASIGTRTADQGVPHLDGASLCDLSDAADQIDAPSACLTEAGYAKPCLLRNDPTSPSQKPRTAIPWSFWELAGFDPPQLSGKNRSISLSSNDVPAMQIMENVAWSR